MSIISNQFNETLANQVDGLPSKNGGLLFAITINQPKFLTHISAALVSTTVAYTGSDNVMGRLVVCTGGLQYSVPDQLFYGPYPKSTIYPAGTGRVLLDTQFINNIQLDFTDPLFCTNNEILNVCIGIGWIQGEVGPGITPCLGYLSVNGHNNADTGKEFPYRLR